MDIKKLDISTLSRKSLLSIKICQPLTCLPILQILLYRHVSYAHALSYTHTHTFIYTTPISKCRHSHTTYIFITQLRVKNEGAYNDFCTIKGAVDYLKIPHFRLDTSNKYTIIAISNINKTYMSDILKYISYLLHHSEPICLQHLCY